MVENTWFFRRHGLKGPAHFQFCSYRRGCPEGGPGTWTPEHPCTAPEIPEANGLQHFLLLCRCGRYVASHGLSLSAEGFVVAGVQRLFCIGDVFHLHDPCAVGIAVQHFRRIQQPSSLTAATTPVTGLTRSLTAFTDSTSPKASPAVTWSPSPGRLMNTTSPRAS